MTYLGTLKTLIYNPLFHLFGYGLRVLREPGLIAGAITLVLFFLILRRLSGDRAALIGCGLLATDSIYLLTNCYDWGPVALQHLLLVSGALCALLFIENKRVIFLGAAFFLWGLELWDKALAVWVFSGLALAVLAVFPRQFVGLVTRRRVAISLLAFILGAFPLLRFNMKWHWVTFRGNFTRDINFYRKLPNLLYTLDGRGLFGYMMPFPDQSAPSPHSATTAISAASDNISSLAGHPTSDWMAYALVLAILLTALARGRELRAILFCLVMLVVGWLEMAITAGAGGAVHHTILLWPLPHAIIALALAAASCKLGRIGRPAVWTVAGLLMVSNLLVLNEYYRSLRRNGAIMAWSTAMLPLSDYLKKTPADYVFCADWGILESLRYLNAGKLPLHDAQSPIVQPNLGANDTQMILSMLDTPQHLYIVRTDEYEQVPGIRKKLLAFARQHGYASEMLAPISDGFGRQVFEIWRFTKQSSAAQ
jgi:hypothetical protein